MVVVEVGVCRARTCIRAAAAVVRRAILDSICFCVCSEILIFFLIDPKNKYISTNHKIQNLQLKNQLNEKSFVVDRRREKKSTKE